MQPWARLCAAYPRFEVGEATLMVYYQHLCKYDWRQLVDAIDVCVAHSPYFPAVAELISAVKPRTPMPSDDRLLGEPHNEKVKDLIHELAEKFDVSKKVL